VSRRAFLIPGALVLMAALSAGGLAWQDASDGILLIILIAALAVAGITASTILSIRRITAGARRFAAGDPGAIDLASRSLTGELVDALNDITHGFDSRILATAQEQSRLTAALDSSIDALIALDAQDRISFANLAAERLFGRSREELLGNPLVWVMPNEQVIAALRKSRDEGRNEIDLMDTPSRRQLHVIITPIIGGGDWTVLAVFHDLTEVRRIERVRRDFVANVSHELRTPLASIKAVIETLQGGALDDRAAAEDFLSRADLEVDRLAQMVEELLELSRIESGEVPLAREPVDLTAVVTRAIARLSAQAGKQEVVLAAEIEAGLPAVTGDAERLERAVVNLIHNAIKFTPPGGTVDVSVTLSGASVSVFVVDTGAGISPEDLPRVFERFYKTDQSRHGGGTGLGLAVVKHTVEAHGGTVTAESEPGRGSTFSFVIPVAR